MAGKSYARVKKEKKIKKRFGKKQTKTSLSSISDEDPPALPPKTPERTLGEQGPSFTKPPPTPARVEEKKENVKSTANEDKVIKVEERKTGMASSPLKKVDEKISGLRNKYQKNDERFATEVRRRRKETWDERRPVEQEEW